MARTLVSMKQLRGLVLAAIRKYPGCEDVTDVTIYRVTDNQAENSWSVGVVGCGNAAPSEALRAAFSAQQALAPE
jgi:hypothetical protein